jgi:spore germination protein GerM
MKKIIILIFIIASLIIIGFYALNNYIYNEKQGNENFQTIKLYFYNPALDQGVGGVQCTKAGLVEVTRLIPKTETPLQDSIRLLLEGKITDEEKAQGVTTEFPLSGVSLKSVNLKEGVATLEFIDPQNRTGGGSCRVAILWAQIEATAKQFSTVKEVRFIPEELFQP